VTAHRVLSATSIGDGVAAACSPATMPTGGTGRVVGTFSSGFYVESAMGLFAVGGPRIPAGPIHLVLECAPPPPPEGSIVRFGPERLWTEPGMIGLSRAARYWPYQPSPTNLRTIAPVLARLGHLDTVPNDVAHLWPAVRTAVEQAELHVARQLLQGVGGGLTPTGDDVLAGLLLFARWADPQSPEPTEVAQQAATTVLSRCFLAWAARGQSIQPVHDLIDAAGNLTSQADAASPPAALDGFQRAIATVASIGGTSGKGMLCGLGLAAVAWSVAPQEDALSP
jgi:Protein of unknown function (DUF2877)